MSQNLNQTYNNTLYNEEHQFLQIGEQTLKLIVESEYDITKINKQVIDDPGKVGTGAIVALGILGVVLAPILLPAIIFVTPVAKLTTYCKRFHFNHDKKELTVIQGDHVVNWFKTGNRRPSKTFTFSDITGIKVEDRPHFEGIYHEGGGGSNGGDGFTCGPYTIKSYIRMFFLVIKGEKYHICSTSMTKSQYTIQGNMKVYDNTPMEFINILQKCDLPIMFGEAEHTYTEKDHYPKIEGEWYNENNQSKLNAEKPVYITNKVQVCMNPDTKQYYSLLDPTVAAQCTHNILAKL